MRMMCSTKLLVALLLMLGLLLFLCACDSRDVPEEITTHGSGVTESQVPEKEETEALSDPETEADSAEPSETEEETGEKNETEIVTDDRNEFASDTDTSSETTSPVIELPKVEFD